MELPGHFHTEYTPFIFHYGIVLFISKLSIPRAEKQIDATEWFTAQYKPFSGISWFFVFSTHL